MSEYILDVQGLRGFGGEFIPKEIAMMDVSSTNNALLHWIIEPDFMVYTRLPMSVRRQNEYLTKNYHGFDWYSGDVKRKTVEENIHRILKQNVRIIYVKGIEKCNYVKSFTDTPIMNLEKEIHSNPTSISSMEMRCIYHQNMTNQRFVCALNNCVKIKDFMTKGREVIIDAAAATTTTTTTTATIDDVEQQQQQQQQQRVQEEAYCEEKEMEEKKRIVVKEVKVVNKKDCDELVELARLLQSCVAKLEMNNVSWV